MMRANQTIETIASIDHATNSAHGCPNYWVRFHRTPSERLHIDPDRAYRTSDNSSSNWGLGSNPGVREGDRVQVTWTRAGRIAYVAGADDLRTAARNYGAALDRIADPAKRRKLDRMRADAVEALALITDPEGNADR